MLKKFTEKLKLSLLDRGWFGGKENHDYAALKLEDVYGIQTLGVDEEGYAHISPVAVLNEEDRASLENTLMRQLGIKLVDIDLRKFAAVNIQLNKGNMVIDGKAQIEVQTVSDGEHLDVGKWIKSGVHDICTLRLRLNDIAPIRATQTKAENTGSGKSFLAEKLAYGKLIYGTSQKLRELEEGSGISLGEGDGGMEANPETLANLDNAPYTAKGSNWVEKNKPKGRVNEEGKSNEGIV